MSTEQHPPKKCSNLPTKPLPPGVDLFHDGGAQSNPLDGTGSLWHRGKGEPLDDAAAGGVGSWVFAWFWDVLGDFFIFFLCAMFF